MTIVLFFPGTLQTHSAPAAVDEGRGKVEPNDASGNGCEIFRKKRPRQSRDDTVYGRNFHRLADGAYILDRLFEQWNARVLGSENGGKSWIDFDRCKLRLRAQGPQYMVGKNAGSRTVFENCIRTFQAGLLNHHSCKIRRTGNRRTRT